MTSNKLVGLAEVEEVEIEEEVEGEGEGGGDDFLEISIWLSRTSTAGLIKSKREPVEVLPDSVLADSLLSTSMFRASWAVVGVVRTMSRLVPAVAGVCLGADVHSPYLMTDTCGPAGGGSVLSSYVLKEDHQSLMLLMS